MPLRDVLASAWGAKPHRVRLAVVAPFAPVPNRAAGEACRALGLEEVDAPQPGLDRCVGVPHSLARTASPSPMLAPGHRRP
jgi:hypothetical protein